MNLAFVNVHSPIRDGQHAGAIIKYSKVSPGCLVGKSNKQVAKEKSRATSRVAACRVTLNAPKAAKVVG